MRRVARSVGTTSPTEVVARTSVMKRPIAQVRRAPVAKRRGSAMNTREQEEETPRALSLEGPEVDLEASQEHEQEQAELSEQVEELGPVDPSGDGPDHDSEQKLEHDRGSSRRPAIRGRQNAAVAMRMREVACSTVAGSFSVYRGSSLR